MNNTPRTLFLLICCAALLNTGCNNHDNKKEDGQAAILHQMPFAPVTDSIDRAKDNRTAGLYFRRGELLSRANKHELAAEDFKRSWDLAPEELTGFRYASTLAIIGQ